MPNLPRRARPTTIAAEAAPALAWQGGCAYHYHGLQLQPDLIGETAMKRVFPALLAVLTLSACPDTRTPKPPPRVPEPKMVSTAAASLALSRTGLTRADAGAAA